MTDAALQLHPDRLLPADPTTRGIARRLYAAVRDLPIISPHGHVPPEWLADDIAVRRPDLAADLPRPLRLPAAARPRRRRWTSLGVGGAPLDAGRGPRGLAGALRALGRLPRARRAGSGWRASSPTSSASTVRPSRGDRRRDLRPDRRHACADPTSGRARCWSASASRCSRPPTTRATTWPHHAALARRRRRFAPGSSPTFRPDRYLEPGRPDLRRAHRPRSARRPASTPATTRASSRRWRTGAATSRRTAPSPPTTATPTSAPPRWTTAEAERIYAAARAGTATPTRPPRCAATCCSRWPGCRSRTAWS